MNNKTALFWFRQDLRIADNPGLFEAAQHGCVIPIYIFDTDDRAKIGSASRVWLHHSLHSLNKNLDFKLNIYIGKSIDIISNIINIYDIDAVYWNKCYEPWRIDSDSLIKADLVSKNIECKSFNGSLLWEPWEVCKKDKTPYKVFTPFYRNLQAKLIRSPLPKIKSIDLIKDYYNLTTIENLELLPKVKWDLQIKPHWQIGEEAAQVRLTEFLEHNLQGYKQDRDYPFKKHVSMLSPHLHFGEISPHQVWHGVQAQGLCNGWVKDTDHFLSELGWREFSHHLLYHFPESVNRNFQQKFDRFPWKENPSFIKAWQTGKTGYPIVDAGMRELWQTGYMHNRVRMIVGSFLVKNLLIHWHHGRDWFWDCLVDADLANNTMGWQWVAGSGADAAPYFRIFNPITQGEKFDPSGEYTRCFVPELHKLPNDYLFKPWKAPQAVLSACDIELGKTYPFPVVNLEESRNIALQAYHDNF